MSCVVILPSVGIRAHRIFLSDRPSCRQLKLAAPAPVVGAPVWDVRADGGGIGVSAILSVLIVVALCACALRAI